MEAKGVSVAVHNLAFEDFEKIKKYKLTANTAITAKFRINESGDFENDNQLNSPKVITLLPFFIIDTYR